MKIIEWLFHWPLLDVQLLKELEHVRVSPEKDVQAGLIPVAIFVLPGCNLAAKNITSLDHNRGVASITEVLGT